MQSSITIQNGSGAEVRAAINNALQSIVTDFAGATDPSTLTPTNAFPFCTWLDTANNLVKRRNASNTAWITIGTLNSSGKIMLYNVYGQSGSLTVTANTTLTASNINNLVVANSSSNITIALPTPTQYMSFKIFNKGLGTVTVNNGTIYTSTGSVTSLNLTSNQSVQLSSDGTSFYTI